MMGNRTLEQILSRASIGCNLKVHSGPQSFATPLFVYCKTVKDRVFRRVAVVVTAPSNFAECVRFIEGLSGFVRSAHFKEDRCSLRIP